MGEGPSDTENPLEVRLGGGDRRSIGAANEVATDIEAGTVDLSEVIALMAHSDPVIAMRAADAAEKATRSEPAGLQTHRKFLIELTERAEQQELRWHLAQLTPRLDLTHADAQRVASTLERYLDDKSSIVKTNTLQALADLARDHPDHKRRVTTILTQAARNGTPAMKARANKLLARPCDNNGSDR